MPQTDCIPQNYRAHALEVAKAMQAIDHVLLLAHVNLDGDALGSLVACALMLQGMGKKVVIASASGVPEFLSFFPLPHPLIRDPSELPFTPKAACLLDLGTFSRVGESFRSLAEGLERINVDHHEGSGIGTLATWVEPHAAATTELMAYVALALGKQLDGALARAIALGLVTDTGGFSHANTSAEVFALCAHLVRLGCDIAALRSEIDSNIRHERMLLWARLAPKVRFLREGKLAICAISEEDFASVGATKEDSEGFVEYMLRLKGVALSALVREQGGGMCKFSLRSQPALDVWDIAQRLHGGGHHNAAGGTLALPLEESVSLLSDTILEHTFF